MLCYGLEEIARVEHAVDSERLEKFFPSVVKTGGLRKLSYLSVLGKVALPPSG